MARGINRLRIAQSKVTNPAAQLTKTSDVLRPTQKSVQAIRSRISLFNQWLAPVKTVSLKIGRRGANISKNGAATLINKTKSASASLWKNVHTKVRRRPDKITREPNLDVLFARPINETKTEAVPSKASATPALALTTFHRPSKPQKKKLPALQRAQQALQAKEYQHAEDILVDYIIHHTKDTKAYMLLGKVATARTDWPEAMEIFEQVVNLRPQEPGAQAGLGLAAYNCGRYSLALQALQRAHEADPTNLVVLNDLLAIAKKLDNPALQRSIQTELSKIAGSKSIPAGQQS